MLSYNEIAKKKYIVLNGEPYEVLDSNIFRKQQRRPVNQTKLRNLITGKVTEQTFQQSDKAKEADLEKKTIEYIYKKQVGRETQYWFKNPDDPSRRFDLSDDAVGEKGSYLKEGMDIEALYFEDEIIGINLPIKVVYKVTEAPPNVKGNTAQGGNKQVVIETGASITTPMFVEKGDKIEVNTETGEYVGRAS